jgi:fimbrial isopeptide formation D2 family protein
LYGGFNTTEATVQQRDWRANETILSGDIGLEGVADDNAYHVVTGSGTNATAVLDGFTITGGHANGSDPHNQGGGMFNQNGSPALANVTFTANHATRGGGMYNMMSHPTLTNVTFQDNSASHGGGIWNTSSGPALTNAVFQNNSAVSGAGIYNNWECTPTLVNVTFSGNTATQSGGGVHNWASHTTIHNGILWGNTGGQIAGDETSTTVSYSDVQGGWPGTGNIDADPLFLDEANGDLHLQPESPAIDAGDNDVVPPAVTTDLDGNPRIINGKVDMGAFESTYEFPPSLTKEVDQTTTQPGTRITYTIVAENLKSVEPLTDAMIVDDLQAGLTFAGPITLDPPGAGTIGTPPELVSDLTLAPGERITVTFPVTVNADIPAPAIIVNTASLSSPHILTPTVSSVSVYVSAPAPPACSARPESSQIVYSSQDASALQAAVTDAVDGDTVKVAGTCRGVQALGAGTQPLYIP